MKHRTWTAPRLIRTILALACASVALVPVTAQAQPTKNRPDTPTRAQDLRLGDEKSPAPAVSQARKQPEDVPIADDARPAIRARGASVLRLRQEGVNPFSAVAVSWRAGGTEAVSVAVRTRAASGRGWSPWSTVTAEEPGRQRGERDGTQLVFTGPSAAVDVVVTAPSGRTPTDVRAHLIDPGYRATDQSAATLAVTPAPSAATLAAPRPQLPLAIRSRAQWGADERQMTWQPEYASRVNAVTVHHTAGTNNYQPEDVPAILRSIYRYQAVTLGWGDIGYNVLVDKFGRAWEGRAGGLDYPVVGAHAGGFNAGTSGVAVMGDFTGTDPNSAILETTARFIAYKLDRYGVDPRGTTRLTGGPSTKYSTRVTITLPTVFPHNATSATACPGARLEARLTWLRNRAAGLHNSVARVAVR